MRTPFSSAHRSDNFRFFNVLFLIFFFTTEDLFLWSRSDLIYSEFHGHSIVENPMHLLLQCFLPSITVYLILYNVLVVADFVMCHFCFYFLPFIVTGLKMLRYSSSCVEVVDVLRRKLTIKIPIFCFVILSSNLFLVNNDDVLDV